MHADHRKETAREPRNKALAYSNRGNAYGKKGEFDRAMADYAKAIELNPNFAKAHYGRGLAYEKTGDRVKAIGDYRKVLEIDPSNQYAKEDLKRMGVKP